MSALPKGKVWGYAGVVGQGWDLWQGCSVGELCGSGRDEAPNLTHRTLQPAPVPAELVLQPHLHRAAPDLSADSL